MRMECHAGCGRQPVDRDGFFKLHSNDRGEFCPASFEPSERYEDLQRRRQALDRPRVQQEVIAARSRIRGARAA